MLLLSVNKDSWEINHPPGVEQVTDKQEAAAWRLYNKTKQGYTLTSVSVKGAAHGE